MNHHEINLKAYHDNCELYCDKNQEWRTGGLTGEERIQYIISQTSPAQSKVFEIGWWNGDDALIWKKMWYQIETSDGVPAFVEMQEAKWLTAHQFDLIDDAFPTDDLYDIIYANAVFVHFAPMETMMIITELMDHLDSEWIIFFSVKKWEWSQLDTTKWFEKRYHYYTPTMIEEMCEENGWELIDLKYPVDEKWIHCTISNGSTAIR